MPAQCDCPCHLYVFFFLSVLFTNYYSITGLYSFCPDASTRSILHLVHNRPFLWCRRCGLRLLTIITGPLDAHPSLHTPSSTVIRMPTLPQLDPIPLHVHFLSAGTHTLQWLPLPHGEEVIRQQWRNHARLPPWPQPQWPWPQHQHWSHSVEVVMIAIQPFVTTMPRLHGIYKISPGRKYNTVYTSWPRKYRLHGIHKVGPGSTGYTVYTKSAQEVQVTCYIHSQPGKCS